jgi:hypothetical protein
MIGDERFRCPEALFKPKLIESEEPGIPSLLLLLFFFFFFI